MLLENKKLLITGVLTRQSIAFSAAKVAQEQGAEILLTSFGRAMSLTERTSRELPEKVEVLELDANNDTHIAAVSDNIRSRWGSLDGFLHAIAFAPPDALGGSFMDTPWASVQTAFQTSAFSLKALAAGFRPLMSSGGSIVSMDFDATVAWPIYDWMGVAKAALESINRYLARYLGADRIRVNCVSAGPLRTMAAKGIPGFDELATAWSRKSPLPWDLSDPEPVARTIAFLLSDWSSGITGEIIHVDGGYHAMGADLPERMNTET
ncbi:MAG: enoyl-ACP reductase FabI [Actinomycetota bacterium]|nr:enoyl-ACP reductase FabI [Actinomycetota bacterium]